MSSPPKLIIIGAPASGKGTQCEKIKEHFRVVHLSTGDMLREAVAQGVEAGLQAKAFMDRGELVPDQLVIGIIMERIQHDDCVSRGWMLDGFPRTNVQAQALIKAGVICDAVVYIDVPDALLVERAVGRRLDPETGRIYHLQYSPPPAEIVGRLVHRSDDSEAKVKLRLKAFHQHVGSILNTLPDNIIRVAGDRPVSAVWNDVLFQLNRMLRKKVVFMIGGPGTGKRTQSESIAGGGAGYAHIDAMALLKAERRNALSPVAGDIADCLISNAPIPPHITIDLIRKAIDATGGDRFVISNFPRTREDLSSWLDTMGSRTIFEFAIVLSGPDGLCQERLSSRSNTTPGKDSETMFSIVSRMKTYRAEASPLLASLKRLGKARVISVVPPAEVVFAHVMKLIRSISMIPPFERTLAIVKPDAVANGNAPDILKEITANDLVVLDTKFVSMDGEAVNAFYEEHAGKPFFPKLSAFMTSGPALVLVLEGVEAVSKWRAMMGPTNSTVAAMEAPHTLRGRFGTDGTQNACHGSDSSRSAMRELDFWYDVQSGPGYRLTIGVGESSGSVVMASADSDPCKVDCGMAEEITFAVIKPFSADANYDHIMSVILGHGFTVTAETRTSLTPAEVDILYEDIKNRPFFPPLRRYMSSGPMVVLLLSRIGAVPAWRHLMGGSDLDKTRKERPNSIRALFAIDGIKNAVHGSENSMAVQRSRKFFFNIGSVEPGGKKPNAAAPPPTASEEPSGADGPFDPTGAAQNRRRKRAKASQVMSMARYGNLAEYLISNVDPVIKELTTHVMQKRPADVIGFAIKDLVEMQRSSFKSKPEASKLSPVGSLGSLRKFPSQSPMKSKSVSALPSIDAHEDTSVIEEEEEDAPTFNGNPLTVDIARMEISRLQTMVTSISQNVRESISENQSSDLDKVDPELIRRMTRREISVLHMGNTYQYSDKVPLFSSLVKKLSLESSNRKAGQALVLHSGGFASGGSTLSAASVQDDVRKNYVSVLNEIGVHFGVLGFHDFQLGLPILRSLIESSTTTWLCSNLVDPFNGKSVSGTQQSVVIDWNGIKVGLLGFVGDWLGLCNRITANDVQYLDVCETADKLCAELKVQGAECIIALTHCSNDVNDELARACADIDLILGGQDERYRVVVAEEGYTRARVVNSGSNFEDLSRIKVFTQEGDRRVTVQWPPARYSVVPEDYPELVADSAVANILEEMAACDTEVSSRDLVAYCDVVLDCTSESVRSGENALANFFVDILRQYGESDIALLHGGFIRSNSVQPTGFLSLATLQKILQFDDFAVTVELTGTQIQQALENGVSRIASNDGRFLHASGLTYYFNPDDAVGYRVSNVQIRKTVEGDQLAVFEPIQPDAVYTCVLPSYIANGGDGYSFLKSVPWKVPKSACRRIKHVILEHLQRRIKPVNAQAELTMTDFDSIDSKIEERIVRVRSSQAMFEGGDDESLGDEGTVQTGTAVCQDDDGGNSVVGESSVAPDDSADVGGSGAEEAREKADRTEEQEI